MLFFEWYRRKESVGQNKILTYYIVSYCLPVFTHTHTHMSNDEVDKTSTTLFPLNLGVKKCSLGEIISSPKHYPLVFTSRFLILYDVLLILSVLIMKTDFSKINLNRF